MLPIYQLLYINENTAQTLVLHFCTLLLMVVKVSLAVIRIHTIVLRF